MVAQRLQPDAAQRMAAARLDVLSKDLRARSPTVLSRLRARWPWPSRTQTAPARGVYLWGGVGRGKTRLMDLWVASLQPVALAPPGAAPSATSTSALRIERSHFYHFMRDIHAQLRDFEQVPEPLERVAERLAERTRAICLDEFFVADIADAMILSGLFAGLFRRGVTLVATSNVPPRELYKNGLQRQRFLPAIALIEAHVDVIHLDGDIDYRLRQLEKAPIYLDSGRTAAATELAARFRDLTGGMQHGPSTLRIEGRELHATNSAPGVVWFEFSELCEGPRSQNDYIELAHLYHTIILSQVPTFDRDSDNAARRFIMLIDELYDRGVKIIVSAAAAPTSLYRGERLQFEFERAASRLMEMQTQDYLAVQHRP